MPGRDTAYEALAREAADRIDQARQLGEQLTFLPDEGPAPAVQGGEGGEGDGSGRTRGPGKALSQMRTFLASKGWRMPEETLAEMALLASSEDAFLAAMMRAEQVLAWAATGADNREWTGKGWVTSRDPETGEALPWQPTAKDRLATFQFVYTAALRAADALMPYGTPKVTPDQVNNTQVTQIIMPGSAAPGDAARPIEGRATSRTAPPPLPGATEQNQEVTDAETVRTPKGARTE